MQAHLYARPRNMHFCTNEGGQKRECGIVSDSLVLFYFFIVLTTPGEKACSWHVWHPQSIQAQIIQSTIMCTYEGAYHGSTITRSISSMPRLFIASTKGPCSFTVASHSAYSTASCAHTKEEDEEPPCQVQQRLTPCMIRSCMENLQSNIPLIPIQIRDTNKILIKKSK